MSTTSCFPTKKIFALINEANRGNKMSEIKTSGRNVEVSDISSKNSFRVSFPFDRVFSSSNDIINQYRDDFPLRIVSVCSSDLLFEQISSSFQSIVDIYFEILE